MEQEAHPVEEFHYFATPIYITKQPQFLDVVRDIAADCLDKATVGQEIDPLYPLRMSSSLLEDDRIAEFAMFVANTAWDILARQGYAMDGFQTTFTEMWCQEHFYSSSMDYHAHPGGNFIVGFYFLDAPEGAPLAVVHDPRPGRIMMDLPQADVNQATLASTMINFKPEPGMMMFAPAWLAHSFGRNASKEPFRFVHFNLAVQPMQVSFCPSSAEVI